MREGRQNDRMIDGVIGTAAPTAAHPPHRNSPVLEGRPHRHAGNVSEDVAGENEWNVSIAGFVDVYGRPRRAQ